MLHIVTGPPAGGKTTYVEEHARPGDIRIDLDAIANLLTGRPHGNHAHEGYALSVGRAARSAAVQAALPLSADHDVWIIHSRPSKQQRDEYRALHAQFHDIDPGKGIVMSRCKRERPADSLKFAASFYPGKSSSKARSDAYGYRHQVATKRLIYNLDEGEPCWWCGRPMYRTHELHADHTQSVRHGGDLPDRLLHGACNEQRRAGDDDHRRPALGGAEAFPMRPIRLRGGGVDDRFNTAPSRPPAAQPQAVAGVVSNTGFTWGV